MNRWLKLLVFAGLGTSIGWGLGFLGRCVEGS